MGLRSASAKRRYTQSVIALVAVLSAGAASAVQVSLPAIIAPPSPTPIVVPVSIADTTGVLGVAVSFAYSPEVVTATQVTGAALAAGCTIVPSIHVWRSDHRRVPDRPVGASGVLFNVTFTGVANGHSDLSSR